MPIKERLSALMENPLYFETPLADRLAMLKGAEHPRLSMTMRLRDLVGQARSQTMNMANAAGKPIVSEPGRTVFPKGEQIQQEGWISDLLHGVLNR